VAESSAVDLEIREDWDVLSATQHGIKLLLLQVGCKGDHKFSIYVDQHQLVCKVVTEIGQMCHAGNNFCEIPNCHQLLDAEHIGFKEDSFLLEPCKKVSIGASKFDVA